MMMFRAVVITSGATGDHVAKIQFALFTLDRRIIDRLELVLQIYGKSTAAAVFAYMKKRKIINHSYQSTADDIVGTMTIASLDNEMKARERLPKSPGDCAISPNGASDLLNTLAAPAGNLSRRTNAITDSKSVRKI